MGKAKRVALYVRVSTDDQTVENQLARIAVLGRVRLRHTTS